MMLASHSINDYARKKRGGTTFIRLAAVNSLQASSLKKPATG